MSEPDVLARTSDVGMAQDRVDLASLDAFVRAHYPRLVRLAGLITRDADQAQDAVQAALERAWRKRADVRDAAQVRPWLDRIVVREAIRLTQIWRPPTSVSARCRRLDAVPSNDDRTDRDGHSSRGARSSLARPPRGRRPAPARRLLG